MPAEEYDRALGRSDSATQVSYGQVSPSAFVTTPPRLRWSGEARSRGGGTNDVEHLRVDPSVGRQHFAESRIERSPGYGRHRPAGFLDQQRSCGDVPRIQPHFPEAVEAACRYIRQIDRGGSETTDCPRGPEEVAEHVEQQLRVCVHGLREAGA